MNGKITNGVSRQSYGFSHLMILRDLGHFFNHKHHSTLDCAKKGINVVYKVPALLFGSTRLSRASRRIATDKTRLNEVSHALIIGGSTKLIELPIGSERNGTLKVAVQDPVVRWSIKPVSNWRLRWKAHDNELVDTLLGGYGRKPSGASLSSGNGSHMILAASRSQRVGPVVSFSRLPQSRIL